MKMVSFSEIIMTSCIRREEYFPVCVDFGSVSQNNCYIDFRYGNDNLFEILVDAETRLVQKIQLLICNNYQINQRMLDAPSCEKTGSIYFHYPSQIDCQLFMLEVYQNCVVIKISSETNLLHFMCGRVIFGIDLKGNLVSIIINEFTRHDINHLLNELGKGLEELNFETQ